MKREILTPLCTLCLLLCISALPLRAACRLRGGRAPQERPEKQEKQEKKTAQMTLAEHVHDFGDVPRRGGDLHYEFAYTNTGSAPLVLLRVQTSCSCLKASFSKRPVAPGASEVIRITYEPLKSEPGSFNKVIQVYSNSAGGRELLTVQGNALDKQ